MDIPLKKIGKEFPNRIICSKIANFHNFVFRQNSYIQTLKNDCFRSKADAVANIQKEFITFIINQKRRKGTGRKKDDLGRIDSIAVEIELFKFADRYFNKWKEKEGTIEKEFNSLVSGKTSSDYDEFQQVSSLVTTDLESFEKLNKRFKKNQTTYWYQAIKRVNRNLEVAKTDSDEIDSEWERSWVRINREYFNKQSVSWNLTLKMILRYFGKINAK
ncbi:hypothetical protein [Leptospira barantonii]|uniref:Uncharacterized protein n=1 Tax=Leptospira barantonii TaxID=2023184 RepID=A0ABX4NRQ3_9LEPT|nr:hypothetical protein [Leptospira barantonii]PJZ58272.1 hypothetical protein CH367_07790 [Leptospira barantonii]